MYKYQEIDIEKWNRKKQYKWFSSFSNPCYGIDTKIDVTEIVNYSKETKTSFFINFLYVVMVSLNSIDSMRLRIVNGEVRLYENINPTFTVMTESGVFENGKSIMNYNYKKFYNEVHENIEIIKKQKEIFGDDYNDDASYDEYYITCLPWLDYEGMTHPLPDHNPESSSCPRICWGKYVLDNDKFILSFNLTVSHSLVDGKPTCDAINLVRENVKCFKKLIQKNY